MGSKAEEAIALDHRRSCGINREMRPYEKPEKKDQRCRKKIQSQLLQLMMELSLSSGRKSSIALNHFKMVSLVP